MKNGTVNCVRGGFDVENDEAKRNEDTDRRILPENTRGPIVPLGEYYSNGIE